MKGTHNERFARVQEEYFKTRDGKYLGDMYLLCSEVAKNCIKKQVMGLHLFLSVDEMAHDAATYVINRYLEDTNFKLDTMVGYVYLCTKGVMYKDKDWEKRNVSLEDWTQETE